MPTTIQAIVCAVDFSPFSPLVVGYGVSLARRAGVRLYLIHAVNDPQDGSHPTAVFERGGDLIHLTDDARQRFRELMRRTDVAWEAVVRFGDPVEQTVRVRGQLAAEPRGLGESWRFRFSAAFYRHRGGTPDPCAQQPHAGGQGGRW
jgi:hypothetical protein